MIVACISPVQRSVGARAPLGNSGIIRWSITIISAAASAQVYPSRLPGRPSFVSNFPRQIRKCRLLYTLQRC